MLCFQGCRWDDDAVNYVFFRNNIFHPDRLPPVQVCVCGLIDRARTRRGFVTPLHECATEQRPFCFGVCMPMFMAIRVRPQRDFPKRVNHIIASAIVATPHFALTHCIYLLVVAVCQQVLKVDLLTMESSTGASLYNMTAGTVDGRCLLRGVDGRRHLTENGCQSLFGNEK